MREEVIDYQLEGKNYKGLLVFDEGTKEARPGILIAHAYKGLDTFAKEKARDLASLGYVAFAADLYGDGLTTTSAEEAMKLMQPLFVDRATLRKRIVGSFDVFKKFPQVDPKRIGAIGFCFGGATLIELLRSGSPVKGVVSFHGILGSHVGDKQAKLEPNHYTPGSAILILNGYEDPMVPESDVSSIQKELNDANIDWQMTTYGHTKHAFMNPEAHQGPMQYSPTVSKRAWASMELFFKEILK